MNPSDPPNPPPGDGADRPSQFTSGEHSTWVPMASREPGPAQVATPEPIERRQTPPPPPPPPLHWPGMDVPPPPPPPPPTGNRRRNKIAIAVASVVIVLVAAIVIDSSLQHHSSAASDTTPSGTTSANSSSSALPATSTTAPVTSTARTSTPAHKPATRSPGGIDLKRVLGNPKTPAVSHMFDVYFSSINAHRVQQALAVYDPQAPFHPLAASTIARFGEQTSTTIDDQASIRSIRNDPDRAGALLVVTYFRSRQAAEYGIDHETCTSWHLIYILTAFGSSYRIWATEKKSSHEAC